MISNLHVLVIGAGEPARRWTHIDNIFRNPELAKQTGIDIVLRMLEFNAQVKQGGFATVTIMKKFKDIAQYIHLSPPLMMHPGSEVYVREIVD